MILGYSLVKYLFEWLKVFDVLSLVVNTSCVDYDDSGPNQNSNENYQAEKGIE